MQLVPVRRQQELGGVLDGDQPFLERNFLDQRLHEGRLARPCLARHDDGLVMEHRLAEELCIPTLLLQRQQLLLERLELLHGRLDAAEDALPFEVAQTRQEARGLADADRDRAGRGGAWLHELDARAGGQRRAEQRRVLAGVLAGQRGHGAGEAAAVQEAQGGCFHALPHAILLHEELARPVQANFGDAGAIEVLPERLEVLDHRRVRARAVEVDDRAGEAHCGLSS